MFKNPIREWKNIFFEDFGGLQISCYTLQRVWNGFIGIGSVCINFQDYYKFAILWALKMGSRIEKCGHIELKNTFKELYFKSKNFILGATISPKIG